MATKSLTSIPFDKKIKDLVDRQLPQFIRTDHATFVTFIEKYYEWMEQNGYTYEAVSNLLKYHDVDYTIDSFLKFIQYEFLHHVPDDLETDKRKFLKHVREFYRAKGTDPSFRTWFRAMFNEEIDIYYPGNDLVKVSDGKWDAVTVIRISATTGDPFKLNSRIITGATSGATAVVETVVQFYEGANSVYELHLSSITGTFQTAESVTGTSTANVAIAGTVYSIVSGVTITNAGSGYSVNDQLTFSGGGGNASGVTAQVESLTVGPLTGFSITTAGNNYRVGDGITFNYTDTGGANAEAQVGTVEEAETKLLLNFDGTDGSTTFTDSSNSGHTVTANSGAMLRTTQIKYGTATGFFDGSNDYLSIPSSADFGMGTGAFTVEFWVYFNALSTQWILAADDNTHFDVSYDHPNTQLEVDLEGQNFPFNWSPAATTWYHVAVTRTGTSLKAFVNGTQIGSTATSNQNVATTGIRIGRKGGSATNYFKGHLDDLRITKGVARYTANFTAPTAKLVLQGPITAVTLINGGYLFSTVPTATVTSSTGSGAAIVAVGANVGGVSSVSITNFGSNYTAVPTVAFPSKSSPLVTATGTATTGPKGTMVGRWTNADGFLNDIKKIQDSYYWQAYAYELQVGQSFDTYRYATKRQLHPAGMQMFGKVLIISSAAATMKALGSASSLFEIEFPDLLSSLGLMIGRAYRSNSYAPTLVKWRTKTLYIDPPVVDQLTKVSLGPTLASIDRFKFTVMSVATTATGGTVHSCQIKDFPAITIAEFATNPGRHEALAAANTGGMYGFPTIIGVNKWLHSNTLNTYDNAVAKWDRTNT